MRRVAWVHVAVETEDEEKLQLWLTLMANAMGRVAVELSKEIPEVQLVDPPESGQSIAVEGSNV